MWLAGAGFMDPSILSPLVRDRLAVLSVLEPGNEIEGIGRRVSDKTYRVDMENFFDFYHARGESKT